jgi:four helix bundle protein
VRLYCALPNRTEIQVIGKQFLRSGTSVGAHLHEAHRSRSDSEMISKIEVGMQELEESRYWILLLTEAGFVDLAKVEPILNEIRELMAILVASVRSLKQRSPAPRTR